MYYDPNDVMRSNPLLPISEEDKKQIELVKYHGHNLYCLLNTLGQSRELSLAKTKIEESVMWAVKHITK